MTKDKRQISPDINPLKTAMRAAGNIAVFVGGACRVQQL